MDNVTRGARVNADITALLRARHTLLWIVTREETRVERAITEAAGNAKYETRFWDCARGISSSTGQALRNDQDPTAALEYVASSSGRVVYVMRDLHKWFDPVVLRRVRNLARSLQSAPANEAKTVVILTPSAEVPPELAGHATVIDYPLPDRAEIAQILDDVLSALPEDMRNAGIYPVNGTRDAAIDAAVGLSAEEAANCYAKSLVTLRKIDPAIVANEKKRVIAREKVLTWHDPDPRGLDAIGGLDVLKDWLRARRSAFSPRARAFGLPAPKGAMLVGIPGCLHPDTPIYDPVADTTETVEARANSAKPFHVWAMGPFGPIRTMALPPQRYSSALMFRLTLDNGSTIVVTGRHRVLSQDGWIYVEDVAQRLECEPVHLVTTLGSDLGVHLKDAGRCHDIRKDSQVDCRSEFHSCDAQLRLVRDDGRAFSLLQVDVPEHIRHDLHPDDQAHDATRTLLYQEFYRLSRRDSARRSCFLKSSGHHELVRQVHEEPRQRDARSNQVASQSLEESDQTGRDLVPSHGALESIASVRYTRVRSVKQETSSVYYDFHVPLFENYWAAGMWHHNCGKSLTAKCIASAWGMPLLRLDMGALKSKWVGESEGNIRRALQVAEAVSPCVLWLDEIEKALGGSTGPQGDGGVAADALGAVLSWMQEREGSVFVVATANDVRALPPELLRKGRFDEVFWVDLPTANERHAILQATLRQHGREPCIVASPNGLNAISDASDRLISVTAGFTGAELAALIPDALFAAFADGERELTTDDLLRAAQTVVPLSKTASEKIDGLRAWAKGRARPASMPETESTQTGRAIDL